MTEKLVMVRLKKNLPSCGIVNPFSNPVSIIKAKKQEIISIEEQMAIGLEKSGFGKIIKPNSIKGEIK